MPSPTVKRYAPLARTATRLQQQLTAQLRPLAPDDPARHALSAADHELSALRERLWLICHSLAQHDRLTVSRRRPPPPIL